MVMQRHQKVVVIQRIADQQFYCGPKGASTPQWTPDIAMANFVSPTKVKSLIRAVWGRDEEDYLAIEVVPALPDKTADRYC